MLHSYIAIYTLMIINPHTDFWIREYNRKKITQLTSFLCPLLSGLLIENEGCLHTSVNDENRGFFACLSLTTGKSAQTN